MDGGGDGVEEDGVAGYTDWCADDGGKEAGCVFVGEGGTYGVYYCAPYSDWIV